MGEAAGGGAARSRVSAEQLDVLLSFMEEHPEFAFGKQSVYSRFSACKLWRLLAERLNAADPAGARKSPDKWCRYWADIKYRARRKSLAGGALGELSLHEERLRELLRAARPRIRARRRDPHSRGASHSDEERKPAAAAPAGAGEESGGSESEAGEWEALGTEELLAEAAMRAALAQEKTAEAAGQAVLLLRDMLELLRRPAPAPAPAPAPPADHLMHHPPHHHRL